MDRARVHRGETSGRSDTRAVIALAVVLALAMSFLALPSSAVAKGGAAKCPGAVIGVPFEQASFSKTNGTVQCKYSKRDSDGVHMVFLSARWVTPGKRPIPHHCELASKRSCPCKHDGGVSSSCECFPWPGESSLSAKVTLIRMPASKAKKAWRTASKWVKQLRPLAEVCPVAEPTPTREPATAPPAPAVTPLPRVTTIILSGRPGDAPPGLGETIALPEDDQHALVVGGPDGEVIREEYIGSAGAIAGFGPFVTDDEGNWSVMATVDVDAAPADPAPTATPASPAPSAVASPDPSTEPMTPAPDPSPVPSSPPAPASVDPAEPATAPAETTPTPEPIATPEPTPVAPTGPPDEGAIRNVQDHIEIMGEMIDDTGTAEWTIPRWDIEALVILRPDLVDKVRLGSGSIVVDTDVGRIHITPIIGESGLVEFRLSRLTWLRTNSIVQGLVRALNAGVADRGGRFRTISVTPKGITLTAEGSTR